MNGVQEEFAGRVTVLNLNVADPANLAIQQAFDMRGHPTAVVLDAENQVAERFFGTVDAATLRAALDAVSVAP